MSEPLRSVDTGPCRTCGWVRTVRVYNSGHVHFVAIGRVGQEGVAPDCCSLCSAWSNLGRQLGLGGDPLGDDMPSDEARHLFADAKTESA